MIAVTAIRVTWAPVAARRSGLLAWISCIVADALQVDGICLRRTARGEFTLSYPARRDAAHRVHPFVLPASEPIRRAIERQVLAAIDLNQVGAP